jgi:hypothetical protein
MKRPPIHLELMDTKQTVHLVAFVDYQRLGVTSEPETEFFLGFYIKPGKAENRFYLLLVNESGLNQRRLTEAGDCIEYAVIVSMAMFPITVTDIMAYQTVCNETLFIGHLSREMNIYKKQLSNVRKRLEKLRFSYLGGKSESQR